MSDVTKICSRGSYEPRIYAYATPGMAAHDGMLKVGYTSRDVESRVREQCGTSDIEYDIVFEGVARRSDGTVFKDHQFHAYLSELGFKRGNGEWFRISADELELAYASFVCGSSDSDGSYVLRPSQESAVRQTLACFAADAEPVLWNAKPRFGKTLTAYDLMLRMDARTVLVLTHRPATSASWASDFGRFVAPRGGWAFVSRDRNVRGFACVRSFEDWVAIDDDVRVVVFVSLQDLEGAEGAGGDHDKLSQVFETMWDLVVIDESHEGVATERAELALTGIEREHELHLSGTPFKAVANNVYDTSHIFNWTYVDEQSAKLRGESAYDDMPELKFMTYRLSDAIAEVVDAGIDLGNGNVEDYMFDLNVFFGARGGKFVNEGIVERFVRNLFFDPHYPFATAEARDELAHTFWVMQRVESCKAMKAMLEEVIPTVPGFEDCKVVLVAGDMADDDDAVKNRNALRRVHEAIGDSGHTITLSAGRLTTGVTVPEWSAVVMLTDMSSPQQYLQAAFRAQNPYVSEVDGRQKVCAYVLDFDPARTLDILGDYATHTSASTDTPRREAVRELLNFLPVIGEGDNGELCELDVEEILSAPVRLKAREVVQRGFVCDHIFASGLRLFGAMSPNEKAFMSLSRVPDAPDGEKVLSSDAGASLARTVEEGEDGRKTLVHDEHEKQARRLREAAACYGEPSTSEPSGSLAGSGSRAKGALSDDVDTVSLHDDDGNLTPTGAFVRSEDVARKATRDVVPNASIGMVNSVVDRVKDAVAEAMDSGLSPEEAYQYVVYDGDSVGEALNEAIAEAQAEQNVRDANKEFRSKVKSLARRFPMLLMAYGHPGVKLAEVVDFIESDDEFREFMYMSREEFQNLLDQSVFDEQVLDAAFSSFMDDKARKANWFKADDDDIFCQIPRQETNLIFPPRSLVIRVIDDLVKERPDCFDDPEAKWFFPNETSGLFVTEVTKRLYLSSAMRRAMPDDRSRLRHILEHQLFVAAPNVVSLRVLESFVFGFKGAETFDRSHFKVLDLSDIDGDDVERIIRDTFGI